MSAILNSLGGFLSVFLILLIVISVAVLIIAICHYVAKHILIKWVDKIFGKKHSDLGRSMFNNRLFHRIAYLIPVAFIYHFSYLFDMDYAHFKIYLAALIRPLAGIYLIYGMTFVLFAVLNCIEERYRKLEISKQRPIKSYLQVIKILLFAMATILAISVALNRSPMYFFAGASALAAVFMLVFKDSILGFVASVQLAAYDMVRIGDSIEMPNFGADGEVIDISLNTVKVQNMDKSIVTIPSYALLTSGIKNWRGMKEAGARRVKRAISIDLYSVKICDQKLLNRLDQIEVLRETLKEKIHEIENYNEEHDIDVRTLANGQHLTNIGIFRYYLHDYLSQHPHVRSDMRILVRQLQGTATGLPLELYFFTKETGTEQYEVIQADIFDYIYAILPVFDLRVFQNSSSSD